MEEAALLLLLAQEELILFACIVAVLLNGIRQKKKRRKQPRKRSCWTRGWLLRRPEHGQFEHLMVELEREDVPSFKNFQRVHPDIFKELLARVAPHIQKEDTFMRPSLSPGIRLAITLRYLASGDSYKSLEYSFRVSNNAISEIIPETCEAIIRELQPEVLTCPTTPEGWLEISKKFEERWNLSNTIGALDGKHLAIKCPRGAGSLYYNYKGFHSIVLLALVDADYKFMYIDVGANGR